MGRSTRAYRRPCPTDQKWGRRMLYRTVYRRTHYVFGFGETMDVTVFLLSLSTTSCGGLLKRNVHRGKTARAWRSQPRQRDQCSGALIVVGLPLPPIVHSFCLPYSLDPRRLMKKSFSDSPSSGIAPVPVMRSFCGSCMTAFPSSFRNS